MGNKDFEDRVDEIVDSISDKFKDKNLVFPDEKTEYNFDEKVELEKLVIKENDLIGKSVSELFVKNYKESIFEKTINKEIHLYTPEQKKNAEKFIRNLGIREIKNIIKQYKAIDQKRAIDYLMNLKDLKYFGDQRYSDNPDDVEKVKFEQKISGFMSMIPKQSSELVPMISYKSIELYSRIMTRITLDLVAKEHKRSPLEIVDSFYDFMKNLHSNYGSEQKLNDLLSYLKKEKDTDIIFR